MSSYIIYAVVLTVHDANVATLDLKEHVTEGELKATLLNRGNVNYDMQNGFTRHAIEENTEGIAVQLGDQYIINHIRLLLWDRDQRVYSYYVEASTDKQDWVRMVDYSIYLCRSWQKLFFQPKLVKYIRVVGTYNSVNYCKFVLHVVSLEAMYSTEQFTLEKGLLVPRLNVATIENSASVTEDVSRARNALINVDVEQYDWDSGYTCHQIGDKCNCRSTAATLRHRKYASFVVEWRRT